MADDPLMGYKSPDADPLMGYKSAAAPSNPVFNISGPWDSPKDQPLGQTAFWNKPADKSWGEYMAAHLQPLDDMVRHATNVGGAGDQLAALMSGSYSDSLKAERAKSAEADARMPGANRLAADYVGAAPIAMWGLGAKAANAAMPYVPAALGRVGPYLAKAIGATAEGAGTGGVTSYGRGEDVGTGAGIGALWGLGSSLFGGKGPDKPPPSAADRAALEADKAAKLATLEQPKFNPTDVDDAYRKSVLSLKPEQRGDISYGMRQNVIRNRSENDRTGGTTAASVNGFARNPFSSVRTNGDEVLAARIRDNLVGPQGVLATAPTTTGHAPGEAKAMHDAFQQATARLNDLDWLSGTKVGTAPAEAAARLKPDSGMLYDQAGRDAVQRLADLAPKDTTPIGAGAGAWQGGKDFVKGILSNKLLGAATGWLTGGLPGAAADLAAQGSADVIKGSLKGAKAADVQRAIDAAKVATTTGQKTLPSDMFPQTPYKDVFERLIRTGAVSGR